VLSLATGELTRLTFDDANELVTDGRRTASRCYFSSSSHEISGMLDVYRVARDGGTPMPVAADRYTTEYFAAPSPAGERWRSPRARTPDRSGGARAQPSRRERDLDRQGTAAPEYTQVTKGGAKDAWPMWSAGGKALYFMSDRSGAQNIWTSRAAAGRRRRREGGDDVQGRPCAVAVDLERRQDDRVRARLRHLDRRHGGGQAREVPIALRGAPAAAASSTGPSAIRSRSWRSRRTARRRRSRSTARSFSARPRTAATPCA
jgi:dipeptidyl aminopeptidase/acylaminoacyl peptidase